ncbi:hypothetical protein E3C22_03125 [Jiella endophytica]|uniref:Uncharacterized protein n=1 Tax=Jiella endophytica TaxID=2558362 RepID=A0A4Y8RT41_9HYPH|nr:hypothetical protein [Jiella endophytica]TFF27465.1 hypothetical protein E3C22_03125 [Jiella endophytica]
MAAAPPRSATRNAGPGRHRARRPHDTAANVRAGLVIFLTAFAGLALFRSGDLVSVTYDLPPGESSEAVVSVAETWDGWMRALGTAELGEAIVETVGAFASGEMFAPTDPGEDDGDRPGTNEESAGEDAG